MERFNPVEHSWETLPCMSQRRHGARVAVISDTLYICGGYDGREYLNTSECFDVKSGTWAHLPPMAQRR